MNPAVVGLAFGAGMLATVNPCGFAMLPSLVSFYLGTNEHGYAERAVTLRLREGIAFGAAVTAGFLAVFSVLGLVLSLGAAGLTRYLPWGTVLIGTGLILLGLWLFAGRHLLIRVPQLQAPREPRSLRAMGLYGVAYAVASLACTLPVFLAVVGTSLVAGSSRFLVFVAYAAGMGVVLMAVALGAVLFQGVITGYLRGIVPYVQQIGALLLIVAGGYLVFTELSILTTYGALAPGGGIL
jgi:cytochrome c-type biogenesis protein